MISILPTLTRVTKFGGAVEIYTWYGDLIQEAWSLVFWINGDYPVVNNVQFAQGELGYTIEGSQDFFFINKNGDLIVNSSNPDAYSIDTDGYINYTY